MNDWVEAEWHADRAQEMFERGRWAEAEAELRKALAMNPEQPEWHFNLGLTLEAAGREREAVNSYERASELINDQPEPLLAAGIVCTRLGEYRRAIEFLQRALRVQAQLESAYSHLIECWIRLDDHDEAETTFYLAQQTLEEPSGTCYAAIAESLIMREQWPRAEYCLRQALRLEPNMPRLRARLGTVYAAIGKSQRAVQMFVRDLRDDPGNIDTLLDYGDLLVDLGRLVEAGEKFRRVLEIEPANVDAHARLGHLAMAAGRFDRAQLEFELVHKLDSRYPHIRLALAEAMLKRGQIEPARRLLIGELEQYDSEPDDDESSMPYHHADDLRRLSEALLAANLSAQAATVLERAIELHGEQPLVLQKLALARLRTGELDLGTATCRRALRLGGDVCICSYNLALAAMYQGRLVEAGGWLKRGLRHQPEDEGLRRLRMRLWFAWAAHVIRGAIFNRRFWRRTRG